MGGIRFISNLVGRLFLGLEKQTFFERWGAYFSFWVGVFKKGGRERSRTEIE